MSKYEIQQKVHFLKTRQVMDKFRRRCTLHRVKLTLVDTKEGLFVYVYNRRKDLLFIISPASVYQSDSMHLTPESLMLNKRRLDLVRDIWLFIPQIIEPDITDKGLFPDV